MSRNVFRIALAIARPGVALVALAAGAAWAAAPIELRGDAAPAAATAEPAPSRDAASRPPAHNPAGAASPSGPGRQGPPLSTWALQPAQAHPVDPRNGVRQHVVLAGETLFSISAKHQVPLRALIDENRLAPPFRLAAGQVLRLPTPRRHRVAPGETLADIADRFAMDARSLALFNRLPKPFQVRPGDVLVLPALARPIAAGPRPPEAEAPGNAAPSLPAPPGGARFAWPVEGEVLARFGPQPGGRRLDGLDIGGRLGAPVLAAAAGRVVYAGDDLVGYGRLMLIQHPGGWMTAYAHLGEMAVREGAAVAKGQRIAAMGATPEGLAKLHFQVRRGREPTDPLRLLPEA